MSNSPSKKIPWLAVGAVAIAFGFAFELMRTPAPEPEPELAIPIDERSGDAESDEPMNNSSLLGFLATDLGGPAADAVARAVAADPKLKDRWAQAVRKSPGGKPGVLLAEIAGDKGFDRLLTRMKGDKGVKKLLEPAGSLAKGGGGGGSSFSASAVSARASAVDAVGAPVVRARTAAGSPRPALVGVAPGARGGRSALAQDLRSRGSLGSSAAGGSAVLAAAAGPSSPGSPASERSGLGASAASSGVADPAGSPAAQPAGGGGVGVGGGAAGPGAHDVPASLTGGPGAVSDRMKRLLEQYPFLAALTEDERRRLLEHVDQDGLWGACFRLELYDRCAAACQGAGSKCTPVTRWNACLQYKDKDQNACLDLCAQQRGCVPPMEVTCQKCKGVLEGGKCNMKDFCEYPVHNFHSFYDCLKKYGGHSCSGTKYCKNCCGPAGGGPGPGYDKFTVWCELPQGEGDRERHLAPSSPASPCKYAGKTCEQICSPFANTGTFPCGSPQCRNEGDAASCAGSCVRWDRSCPGDSRCDPSVRQTKGERPSQTSRPCP